VIGWFKFFEKIALDPSLVPASYLPHISSILSEDIKYEEDMRAYFKRFRKLLCIPEIKMEQSKILRLKS
jgi:hypothetical protein